MPSPGYDPSRTEGTLEPTLPDPPGAPLRLPSFGSFFGLFAPSSPGRTPGNTTVPNTPSARSVASSPSTPTPSTPNRRIRRAIARLNRQERREEQEREKRAAECIQRRRRLEESNVRALVPYSLRCTIKGFYRYLQEPVSRIAALVKQPYSTVHHIVNEAHTPTRGGCRNHFIHIFCRESHLFLLLHVFSNLVPVRILDKQPLLSLLCVYVDPEASVDGSMV